MGDDVAVGKTQGHIVGRRFVEYVSVRSSVLDATVIRGLAGTVLVYKIAGALAEAGAQLGEVHDIAEWVANNVVTIGASLGHVHVSVRFRNTSMMIDHGRFLELPPCKAIYLLMNWR